MQLKVRPCVGTLTRYPPWLQLIRKCCVYIACCCYSPCVHKQVPGCTVAIVTLLACSCKLLHCGVPGVVIVAQLLYLKCMHVLVETSIYVACYSHQGISTYVLLLQLYKLLTQLRADQISEAEPSNQLLRMRDNQASCELVSNTARSLHSHNQRGSLALDER